MVSLDSSMLIQIVNFLIIIFVLNALLYKPILKMIDRRNADIEADRDDARALHEEIDKKIAEHDDRLQQARREAMGQRDEMVREADEKGRQIVDGMRAEIAKMVAELRGKLEKEKEQARVVLRDRTQVIATEISEKILGRSIQ